MTATKEDRERDELLRRMLNTPPEPKVAILKKKAKKKRATSSRA
jgi:hypothetical protein